MNGDKLFKKIEKFFSEEKTREEKRAETRAKLKDSLDKKLLSLRKKIQEAKDADKKAKLKKQTKILKDFMKKLEGWS